MNAPASSSPSTAFVFLCSSTTVSFRVTLPHYASMLDASVSPLTLRVRARLSPPSRREVVGAEAWSVEQPA